MAYQSGRHFLQIPGPTNVPERVLRAIAAPTIDHRGPEFADLARHVLAGVGLLCGTSRPVALYPSSGTGAWEAALVNTLSPGDRILAFDNGHFATLWARMARNLGLDVDFVSGDWRRSVHPGQVEEKLSADPDHQIKAVTIVQNETSTGAATQIPLIRAAMDSARHPALLIVDTISSLGSIDYRHDEWGVDVTIWCSQKGMMLPPGLVSTRSARRLSRRRSGPGCRAATGSGSRCSPPPGPGCSPIPRPPTCSSGCARHSPSSARRDCLPSLPGTPGTRRLPAGRSAAGAWRSCARIRTTTPPRSPPCWFLTGTTRTAYAS